MELDSIRKRYGDEFPETIINSIKIRGAKGKIRNYRSYEKIFNWYWTYKQGSIVLDTKRTLQLVRYSDDFCNRLFELWCLYSIKETFIKEFGMSLVNERNIMNVGNQSVFSLKTSSGGDVDIYYQIFRGTQYERMWNLVMKKELLINQVIKKEGEK